MECKQISGYLERLPELAEKYNLCFSYTFDLRPGKFNAPALQQFLALCLPVEHQRVEVVNYAHFALLEPYLSGQNIAFHFTVLDEADKCERFYLTDAGFAGTINSTQNYFTFLRRHLPIVSAVSTHMGVMYNSWDTVLQKKIQPQDYLIQPRDYETAYAEQIQSIQALQKNLRNLGYQEDLLIEPSDYHDRRYYSDFPQYQISPYEYFNESSTVRRIIDTTSAGLLIDT
ncbi:hypothetical protein RDn1_343, partial [Candidatus Termititenax dinenymphae]